MSLEKNQEYEITIEDIGNEGEGIGHIDGMAVFVKDAVPGDVARIKIIKAKKNYAYGRLMEILTPSADRVEPICPHARQCGGCSIMQLRYEKQLEWKQSKVLNCLKRIGGIADVESNMEPIIGMGSVCLSKSGDNLCTEADGQENNNMLGDEKIRGVKESFPAIRYRNKAQFPVRKDKDGHTVIGFYAGRTHHVIDTDICYLQAPVNDEIIRRFRSFMDEYRVEPYEEEHHSGLVRHILTRVGKKTGEIMVCVIINGTELIGQIPSKNGGKYANVEQELVDCLKDIPGMTSISLNVNQDKTNRILGTRCRTIWGKDTITDYIGNVKYQINPLSFYQVNPEQTEKLYRKALEYADLHGDETVWDLYCGIGTISLFLAQKAKKVMGVEIIPEAIDDARKNAKMNGFDNVEFFVGKAEEVLPEQYKKHGVYADVIVVDPPRKGCDEVALDTMITMAPKKIVYVSCDPATLARDVKVLVAAGYEVEKVCAVDQFGHSGHVETVVQLVNIGVKPDYTVRLEVDVDEFYKTVGEEKRHFVKPD
ncbi:MAG TPA: 23S rRNA (uracil(1939)-C(5))-methyltransferase RlmD [Lachnospiraceae bacterium]|nr:23S rRNA (uracil(1939)-C(5))-methyltransferase RlmD [Lachnospiraceae bacterium]